VVKETWTIIRLINWTTDFFKSKNIPTPRLDAELLLSHLLNLNRIELYLKFDYVLKRKELEEFRELVIRRAKREPIAYITGHKEFWSLDFIVTEDVLVPRPETEVLVEETLKIFKESRQPVNGCRVLEIGTGSGAVAISLAKELPMVSIVASDNSRKALKVAKQNAAKFAMGNNFDLVLGDLFAPFRNENGFCDVIISNPPYVPQGDFLKLSPEIKDFEPQDALNGGKDGLQVFRKIIPDASKYIKKNGYLLLEVGDNQAKRVVRLIEETGLFCKSCIIKDLGGKDRVVKTQKSIEINSGN